MEKKMKKKEKRKNICTLIKINTLYISSINKTCIVPYTEIKPTTTTTKAG